jgi:hypothetical protein
MGCSRHTDKSLPGQLISSNSPAIKPKNKSERSAAMAWHIEISPLGQGV